MSLASVHTRGAFDVFKVSTYFSRGCYSDYVDADFFRFLIQGPTADTVLGRE